MMKAVIFVLLSLLIFSAVATAQTKFDYSLKLDQSSGLVDPGKAISRTLTLTTLYGSPELVKLSCSSSSKDIFCSFTQTSCTPNPSCLSLIKISSSSTALPDTYQLKLSGISASGLSKTATFGLTVNKPASTSTSTSTTTSTTSTDSFPKVTISSDKTKLAVGESFTLKVYATDDYGLAKISWKGDNTPDPSFNYENLIDGKSSNTYTLTNDFKPQKAGTYNFIGRAVDSKGQESTGKLSITVVDLTSSTSTSTTPTTTTNTSSTITRRIVVPTTNITRTVSVDSPPKLSVSVDKKEITTDRQATIFAKASDDKGLVSITIEGDNTPDSYYNDKTIKECNKELSCSTEMDITTEEAGIFAFKIALAYLSFLSTIPH